MLDLWEIYKTFSVVITTFLFIMYLLNITVTSKPLKPNRGSFYCKKVE